MTRTKPFNYQLFLDTGKANCIRHGLHDQWRLFKKNEGRYTAIDCRLCDRVPTPRVLKRTGWLETGKATCRHHGEHSDFVLKPRKRKNHPECNICILARNAKRNEKRRADRRINRDKDKSNSKED